MLLTYRIEHDRLAVALKNAREKAGLTQRDLARRLGKPQSVIAKIELGAQPISAIDLISWAEAVGANPAEILASVLG